MKENAVCKSVDDQSDLQTTPYYRCTFSPAVRKQSPVVLEPAMRIDRHAVSIVEHVTRF